MTDDPRRPAHPSTERLAAPVPRRCRRSWIRPLLVQCLGSCEERQHTFRRTQPLAGPPRSAPWVMKKTRSVSIASPGRASSRCREPDSATRSDRTPPISVLPPDRCCPALARDTTHRASRHLLRLHLAPYRLDADGSSKGFPSKTPLFSREMLGRRTCSAHARSAAQPDVALRRRPVTKPITCNESQAMCLRSSGATRSIEDIRSDAANRFRSASMRMPRSADDADPFDGVDGVARSVGQKTAPRCTFCRR